MISDPVMLLSYINTMLRDKYSNFERLCDAEDIDSQEVVSKLEKIGYKYNAELNQFK